VKRILFISLAVILALSVGLIGCAGEQEEEEEYVIKIAVCGPFGDLQGQNHKDGADMAVAEINGAGGINVGGQTYTLETVEVETKEATEGEDGTTGSTNLAAVIDDVTFCVGGFRTEVVQNYREVAMNKKVLFMDCGAATDALQFSVVTNYNKYKYWFKSTPYNSTFLVKSCLKMTSAVGGVLKATLEGTEAAYPDLLDPDYEVSSAVGGNLRVAILMEDASWCVGMVPAAQYYLPPLGYNTSGDGEIDDWTWLVSPTDPDITDVLTTIESEVKPHIIFTAFSGSVGATYSKNKATLGLPAMTIGINVPGQQLSHWVNTGGACEGEVMLDTWGVGMNNTDYTGDWFADFMTRTGRYPVYTAGTYDAIKAVCKAIDETNSLDSDTLVAWLEDPANAYMESVASEKIMFYPMPADTLEAGVTYALNETQVKAIYPNIDDTWIRFDLTPPYFHVTSGYTQTDWLCGESSKPHIAHDLVYGPGLVTGVGTQWQDVEGAGAKVGIWPMDFGDAKDLQLTDQYGCWNFEYPGKADLYIPTEDFYD
jgi:branched-chain amino acid transport system substrate-binding protein